MVHPVLLTKPSTHRVKTASQSGTKHGSSKYKGVRSIPLAQKWKAMIYDKHTKKTVVVGAYRDEAEAARAWDVVAKRLGRTDLNFPVLDQFDPRASCMLEVGTGRNKVPFTSSTHLRRQPPTQFITGKVMCPLHAPPPAVDIGATQVWPKGLTILTSSLCLWSEPCSLDFSALA